jgi:opacity protein-like surface antigen
VADDSDDGFAWQLMAGADVALSPSVGLFLQYTYRQAFERAEVPLTLLPATHGVEAGGSLVTAGIRFAL